MSNTNQLISANLKDRSIIEFSEIFEAMRGSYHVTELFEKQWEIVEHVNLCLLEEKSFINDLTDLEKTAFRCVVNKRMNKQIEMEIAIKYAGVVPHVADKIEVGTILYSSWGYEQTNIDFYCVVEVSKSMCKLLPMTQKSAESSTHCAMTENVKAGNQIMFDGELLRKKISKDYHGSDCVRIASYASAWLWDGKEKYASYYH